MVSNIVQAAFVFCDILVNDASQSGICFYMKTPPPTPTRQ